VGLKIGFGLKMELVDLKRANGIIWALKETLMGQIE